MADTASICAICGDNEAATRDHIPPRAIFPKPRPSDLITVPACLACNSGASVDDEEFAAYLALRLSTNGNDEGRSLFNRVAMKILKHNRAMRNFVLKSGKRVDLRSEAGLYLGHAFAVPWHSQSHDNVLKRIVRGLYFYHFEEPVPGECEVRVQWLRGIPKEIEKWGHSLPLVNIGNGAFMYKYGRAAEDIRHSIWFFQFYGGHWASGYTKPNEC